MTQQPNKQSLKKDTSLVYVGYALRFLSQIILVPFYGRILGPASYGQILAALSLMAIVSVVVSYGFSMSGVRSIAFSTTRKERSDILSRQTFGRLLLVPVGILIGIGGTFFSPVLSGNPWFGILGTILGLLTAFGPLWLFQGLRKFRTSILLEAMAYPINIALILTFVRNPEDGLNALLALVFSNVVCLAAAYFYACKTADIRLPSLREGWAEIKEATVFFLTSFSFTLLTTGSTYILSIMVSAAEVGYYGGAEKFVTFGIFFLNPLGQVLMPTISNLHKNNANAAFRVARKGLALEMGYGLLAPLAGTLLAPFLIPLILGKSFGPSVPLFQIMMWIYPFAAFKHAAVLYLLVPLKKEKYYLAISLMNVVVNLSAALALVPLYGPTGMAYARVSGEVVATLVLLVILGRLNLLASVFRRHPLQR